MPKRLSNKRPTDVNQLAHFLVGETTKEPETPKAASVPTKSEISRIMSAMGRKGGKKSAKARMTKISPERRREIALKAAKQRWSQRSD
jgi:hypothetical protein